MLQTTRSPRVAAADGVRLSTGQLGAGDALIVSHALPVVSRITEASAREPYLALILALDLTVIDDLRAQLADVSMPIADTQSLSAGPAEASWLVPLMRYIELAHTRLDAQVLGPLVLREIHYRLLLSDAGAMLRQLLDTDSHASRIAKAIHQLRSAYRKPLKVALLARAAAMSASSFHEHFKSVTGTTPLQYQKNLRLSEAQALLSSASSTVAEVAYAVGYESSSHFSRDYRRRFGVPPGRRVRVGANVPEAGTAPSVGIR
jgi:AraC-like DNA-binding protein